MKKLILLLLFPSICLSQSFNSKIKLTSTIVKHDTSFMYVIREKLNAIESINGQEIVEFPITRLFNLRDSTFIIEGWLTQYEIEADTIKLKNLPMKYYEIDFDKKKIKVKTKSNDKNSLFKPKKLKEKLKEKRNKLKKKR